MNWSNHTNNLFVCYRFFACPLGAMYRLLAFILVKELGASPLQITLFISLAPIVALISFYGNLFIRGRPQMLQHLIVGSTLLTFIPALCFPFISNVWFFLFAYASYMMASRAMIPAWVEILRLNVPEEQRGLIFSRGSTLNYIANIAIPIMVSPLLDYSPLSWGWVFFAFAIIQGLSLFLMSQVKVPLSHLETSPPHNFSCLKSTLFGPWQSCWKLIKQNSGFRNYQIVFLFGGGGLILMQPILPIFFKETLNLSYMQLALAFSFCKGVGFALTSPIWGRWIHRVSIHYFNTYVTFFAAVFALLLTVTQGPYLLYFAYLIYGVMQAGSEMSWNLAGPIFSKNQDSTLYTSVNIAMVGVRGCILPFLGEFLFLISNAQTVFLGGGMLCLIGCVFAFCMSIFPVKSSVNEHVPAS